jgi:hypothetical protein
MKIRNIIKLVFIITLVSVTLSSCQWVTAEQPEIEVPDVVSFADHIQPILTSKCISCHQSGGFASSIDFTVGNAYSAITNNQLVNISNPPASLILVPNTDKYPHSNHISNTEKSIILKWIENQALNN